MNFDDIKKLLIQLSLNDIEWVDEYLSICSASSITDNYSENHHILPRSLFPQYEFCDWNIVRLEYSIHREAHRLLAKSGKLAMIRAYNFMMSGRDTNINPAKLPEVRQKISKSKTGKSRPDMRGKRYFGSTDKEKIEQGLLSMGKKLKGTVVVRDKDNNIFRVSISDERLLTGELAPHNKGQHRPNALFKKHPEIARALVSNREEMYTTIAEDYDSIIKHLIDAHNNGKRIFGKHVGKFASNYSRIVMKSKFSYDAIYNDIVQRLSNDTLNK